MAFYTDEDLLLLLCAGDRKAFLHLYEQYKSGLYHYCLRLLRDASAAEDAVQQTFVRVYSHCTTLKDPARLRGWVYTIARNEAFALLRHAGTRVEADAVGEEEEELASPDASALELLERAETAHTLRSAIDRLPEAWREALLLREYDGLSYDEIACVTRQSTAAVKSKLFRARMALTKVMECVTEERSKS
ncbi:MAG: RNA polymerase sigma factor [Acidobacteriota bacterium]